MVLNSMINKTSRVQKRRGQLEAAVISDYTIKWVNRYDPLSAINGYKCASSMYYAGSQMYIYMHKRLSNTSIQNYNLSPTFVPYIPIAN